MRGLLPLGAQEEFVDATGEMTLAEIHLAESWCGRSAVDLESETQSKIAFITRYGRPFLPDDHTVLQQGDLVHMLFLSQRRNDVEETCSPLPGATT